MNMIVVIMHMLDFNVNDIQNHNVTMLKLSVNVI